MYRTVSLLVIALCVVGLGGVARAEITVSVTINGEIDEMLPLLEYLKQMGAGPGGTAEDPLKLHVHSIHGEGATPEEPVAEAPPAAPEPAPAPTLGLVNAAVEPAPVTAGLSALIRVQVEDAAAAVDTITATVENTLIAVDLFDNGTNGDVTAGDNVWSANVLVPAELPAGGYTISFAAYDADGNTVTIPGPAGEQTPVTASVQVEVVRPEAPASETTPAPAPPALAPAEE
ncbi:MAG: hypothetical protein HYV26_09840 [Candidatus Hydrogenedentes bacterium]|nr:hypothetical protein [Candidatus Hydrogenedentota bacterium]